MTVRKVIDFDAEWLRFHIKQARTVGEVLCRYDQYQNKIRAVHGRYEKTNRLYLYANRIEAFVQRLRSHGWAEQLADVRRSDSFVKHLHV